MPQQRPKQLDSPLLPKIFKYAGKAHVWVYRRSSGKVGGKWRIGAGFRKPVPTLLLEHRGRKSGKVFVTLTSDRGVDADGGQRGGPEKVDGQPGGLEREITGVAFEDVAQQAADVVAADRLSPRAARDGLGDEGVAVGDEEGRRPAAGGRCVDRGILGGHRDRRYRASLAND
jgi:hypothetical protein